MSSEALKVDRHSTLYVTDAELIRRMGVPEKIARQAIKALDLNRNTGFPKKQKLWGNRRYWPAVKAWLDRTGGLTMEPPEQALDRFKRMYGP